MVQATGEHTGRVWRYGTWGVSVLCSAGLLLGGCVVAKDKYEAAVADMEAARAELEESRMQYEALEQENEELRTDHEKAAFDLEMLGAEIQQIKDGQQSERDLLATREAQLQRDREAMVSKLQEVQRVHQKLKSWNRTLRDTVRRYEKELKEARAAETKSRARAAQAMKAKTVAPKFPPGMAGKPSSAPAPPPVAVPFNGTATPVNINTASANDLVLFLGLTKEVADKVVSNRPYRLRGELISKQVVPKATFDVIRDRITALPH